MNRPFQTLIALSLTLVWTLPVLAQDPTQNPPPERAMEHVELTLPKGLLPGFTVMDQSLSMDQAVALGLQNNMTIQVAGAETDVRQALVRQAQAKGWPVLSVGANTFLHNKNNQTLMTPEMMMTTGQSAFFQDLNATARMPLFTGGRIRAGVQASGFALAGARASTRQSWVETGYQIRQAYLQALLSQAEHLVHQQHITLQQDLLKNAQARYQVGRGLKSDTLRIQSALADAQRMLNEEHNQLNNSLFDLKAAMGIDLGSQITLSDPLAQQPWQGPQLPELIQKKLIHHPKIQAAQAAVKEVEAQIRVAKAAYLPQVYGQVTGNLRFRSDPPVMGNGVVGMINTSLPVFDRNRSSEIAQITAKLKKAEQELKALELDLGKQIAKAWTDMDFSQQNVGLAEAAVTQSQEDFRLVQRRTEVGRGLQVELQDALLAMREAGLNQAKAIYSHELAKAKLLEAVGSLEETALSPTGNQKP